MVILRWLESVFLFLLKMLFLAFSKIAGPAIFLGSELLSYCYPSTSKLRSYLVLLNYSNFSCNYPWETGFLNTSSNFPLQIATSTILFLIASGCPAQKWAIFLILSTVFRCLWDGQGGQFFWTNSLTPFSFSQSPNRLLGGSDQQDSFSCLIKGFAVSFLKNIFTFKLVGLAFPYLNLPFSAGSYQ